LGLVGSEIGVLVQNSRIFLAGRWQEERQQAVVSIGDRTRVTLVGQPDSLNANRVLDRLDSSAAIALYFE
jgi:hypothetical protein